MHEPYDEDDGYDDDQYNYDYNDQYDPYKFYFQIDTEWLKKYMDHLFNGINLNKLGGIEDLFNYKQPILPEGFKPISFPVNSWNSNTAKGNSFQYLGSNYQGSPIWKKKYFVSDPINTEYKLHLQAHAKHFIQQPAYYNGLFDILN